MAIVKLGFLSVSRSFLQKRLFSRTVVYNLWGNRKLNEEDLNKPVEFSKTEASKVLTRHIRAPEENKPEYQSEVVSLSLAIFLAYFCIFREENDLDELLKRPLEEALLDAEKNLKK